MHPFIAAIFAAGIGFLFCFFGYRLFLVLLSVWGFFAGLWMGVEGMTHIFGTGFFSTVTGWVIGFFIGLITALLSYVFYFVGVAITAAGFGSSLASGFMQALGFEPGFLTLAVTLSSALMMALLVLVLNLQKYVIIALTALGGANGLVLAVLLLLGRVSGDTLPLTGSAIKPILQDSWLWLAAWLILAIAGFVVQLLLNQNFTFSKSQYIQDWG